MRLRFDRGTIVIDESSREYASVDLPGAVWDPRVDRYRAPAFRYRDLTVALWRVGASFGDAAHRPGPGPAAFERPPLRSYQHAALSAWERSDCRGVVALPTGSGKTRVALAALSALGVSALCLVPTRVLLDQWQKELARWAKGPIGCYGDGCRRLAPLTVATLASAERHMPHLGDRFDMLVVDEVHHALAYREALSMCTAPARLGLTATPPQDEKSAVELTRLVGPLVYERKLGELAGSFLAPFELMTVTLDLTDRERDAYDRNMKVFRSMYSRFSKLFPKASWAEFARIAQRSDEGKRAMAAWRHARRILAFTDAKRDALAQLLERHADKRVLVFTSNNESAYEIARTHLIMPITCDIGRAERAEALSKFGVGTLRCLVSARVLNEGVDIPDADVAIIVGGALGEREHVQRIGRLLRPTAGKRAFVYELVSAATAEVGQQMRRSRALALDASA